MSEADVLPVEPEAPGRCLSCYGRLEEGRCADCGLDRGQQQVDLWARDGAALLDALVVFVCRFVAFVCKAQAHAVALWIVHTHAIDASDVAAYLAVTSPARESGKSRLVVEVLPPLVARAWVAAEPSDATVYRKIDRDHPALLFDEIDSVFAKEGGRRGLQAIFNVGYLRGVSIPRADDNGRDLREFDPFGPKAFAGIGRLPDTLDSRSIHVRLRRKTRYEKLERLRLRQIKALAAPLHDAAEMWAAEHAEELRNAEPKLPDELGDRQQDVWEPLLAIADMAGGEWPKRARAAAVELSGGRPDEEQLAVLALRHIRDAFDETKSDRLTSATLLDMLIDREDGPWAVWWAKEIQNDNRKGPASRLARLMRDFDIKPDKVRFPTTPGNSIPLQGYMREWFEDAWSRYLQPDPGRSRPSPERDGTTERHRSEPVLGSEADNTNSGPNQGSSGVPTLWGERGERGADA